MAKLGISTGSAPNDGLGDSLLSGAIKINSNFDEIYSALGSGTTITNSIAFASTAGFSTVAGYATSAGISSSATIAGFTTYSAVAGVASATNYANTSGISTVALFAENLTGTPNTTVGIITAARYLGPGGYLTGIVTSILAGANVSVSQTGGRVTINSTAQEAISTQWTTIVSGIVTSSNVGIGTNTTTSLLDVHGGTLTVRGGNGAVSLQDGVRLNMGSGGQSDASIYYDAVDLRIDTSSSIRIGDGNNNVFSAVAGEGSILYYNGDRKLRTLDTGVDILGNLGVSGILTATDIVVSGVHSATSYLGNASGLTGIVTSLVGGANVTLSNSTGEITIDVDSDSVWQSRALGVTTTGKVGIGTTAITAQLTVKGVGDFDGGLNVVSGVATVTPGHIDIPASSNIKIGNTAAGSGSGRNIGVGDQAIFNLSGGQGHNIAIGEFALNATTTGQYNYVFGDRAGQNITSGSYNVILGSHNGNLNDVDIRTSSNNVIISDGLGNVKLWADSSGNVAIGTASASEKLQVEGTVKATAFDGTLQSSQLTGALPALDGSSLLNVTAVGTGVEIQGFGVTVGTASTVNFTDNLDVSFFQGTATVAGASSVSAATTAYALAGTPDITVGSVTANDEIKTTDSGLNQSALLTNSSSVKNDPELTLYSNNANQFQGPRVELLNSSNGTQIVHLNNSVPFGGGQYFAVEKTTSDGTFVQQMAIYSYLNDEWVFKTGSGEVDGLSINNGQVGIGTTTITSTLTVAGDASIDGTVTATTFSGSGASLTNLPSSQLSGALPALDGSALTGVIASGTGIEIKDDNSIVGSAGTINFGTGLDVSPVSAGVVTVTSSGGSLKSRTVVSASTTSIADDAVGFASVTAFKSYAIMKVGLSTEAWIRLYTDSTSRNNDVNRGIGEDPTPGSGVIAEVVTTGISTQQMITPFAMGGNMDDPVSDTLYVSIKNLSGSTQSITANLTILQLEA